MKIGMCLTATSLLAFGAAPVLAQQFPNVGKVDTSKLPRVGQNGMTAGGQGTISSGGTMKVYTPNQISTMPTKMVNGQKLVFNDGKWNSLVASGAGNYSLVASGAGN